MQTGRILKTGLAVGVVANAYDFVTNTYVFPMLGPAPAFMKDMASVSIPWLVVGDFVAALVLVWFFDKVRASFGPGAKGGATFGLYAGILINYPFWHFIFLLFRDVQYAEAWKFTAMGIVWAVIMGAVAGAVWDKTAPAGAAAG